MVSTISRRRHCHFISVLILIFYLAKLSEGASTHPQVSHLFSKNFSRKLKIIFANFAQRFYANRSSSHFFLSSGNLFFIYLREKQYFQFFQLQDGAYNAVLYVHGFWWMGVGSLEVV